MRISRLGMAAGAVSAALVLAACGGDGGGDGGDGGSEGGILRIASDSTIDSLNPFVGYNQLSYGTYQLTYPYLVQYDAALDFVPHLAEEWSANDEGDTWTFTLVDGATWSDGEVLDAEDVAWSMNTILAYKDGCAGYWAGTTAHMSEVVAVDATTVEIVYDQPVANVLSQLQQVPILPEQFWAPHFTGKKGDCDTVKLEPSADEPYVSGGPFEVVQYEKKGTTILKANEAFYGQLPNVQGLTLQHFDNQDAMISALRSGDVDLLESVPSTAVESLGDAGFDITKSESTFWSELIINTNPDKNNSRELLDPKVREAMAYAMNVEELIDVVWRGNAQPAGSIVPPVTNTDEAPWSDLSLTPTPYDPVKANQILDDAGYELGGDGVRVTPDGDRMSYDLLDPELTDGSRIARLLEGYFAEVGIEIQHKPLDSGAVWEAIIKDDYRDFDLAMWNWVPLIDPDFILSVMLCTEYGNWNDSGYCNEEYDELYALQGSQVDVQERLATVYEMQRIIAEDRPYIIFAYVDWISASSTDWTGYLDTPQGPYNSLGIFSMVEVRKA